MHHYDQVLRTIKAYRNELIAGINNDNEIASSQQRQLTNVDMAFKEFKRQRKIVRDEMIQKHLAAARANFHFGDHGDEGAGEPSPFAPVVGKGGIVSKARPKKKKRRRKTAKELDSDYEPSTSESSSNTDSDLNVLGSRRKTAREIVMTKAPIEKPRPGVSRPADVPKPGDVPMSEELQILLADIERYKKPRPKMPPIPPPHGFTADSWAAKQEADIRQKRDEVQEQPKEQEYKKFMRESQKSAAKKIADSVLAELNKLNIDEPAHDHKCIEVASEFAKDWGSKVIQNGVTSLGDDFKKAVQAAGTTYGTKMITPFTKPQKEKGQKKRNLEVEQQQGQLMEEQERLELIHKLMQEKGRRQQAQEHRNQDEREIEQQMREQQSEEEEEVVLTRLVRQGRQRRGGRRGSERGSLSRRQSPGPPLHDSNAGLSGIPSSPNNEQLPEGQSSNSPQQKLVLRERSAHHPTAEKTSHQRTPRKPSIESRRSRESTPAPSRRSREPTRAPSRRPSRDSTQTRLPPREASPEHPLTALEGVGTITETGRLEEAAGSDTGSQESTGRGTGQTTPARRSGQGTPKSTTKIGISSEDIGQGTRVGSGKAEGLSGQSGGTRGGTPDASKALATPERASGQGRKIETPSGRGRGRGRGSIRRRKMEDSKGVTESVETTSALQTAHGIFPANKLKGLLWYPTIVTGNAHNDDIAFKVKPNLFGWRREGRTNCPICGLMVSTLGEARRPQHFTKHNIETLGIADFFVSGKETELIKGLKDNALKYAKSEQRVVDADDPFTNSIRAIHEAQRVRKKKERQKEQEQEEEEEEREDEEDEEDEEEEEEEEEEDKAGKNEDGGKIKEEGKDESKRAIEDKNKRESQGSNKGGDKVEDSRDIIGSARVGSDRKYSHRPRKSKSDEGTDVPDSRSKRVAYNRAKNAIAYDNTSIGGYYPLRGVTLPPKIELLLPSDSEPKKYDSGLLQSDFHRQLRLIRELTPPVEFIGETPPPDPRPAIMKPLREKDKQIFNQIWRMVGQDPNKKYAHHMTQMSPYRSQGCRLNRPLACENEFSGVKRGIIQAEIDNALHPTRDAKRRRREITQLFLPPAELLDPPPAPLIDEIAVAGELTRIPEVEHGVGESEKYENFLGKGVKNPKQRLDLIREEYPIPLHVWGDVSILHPDFDMGEYFAGGPDPRIVAECGDECRNPQDIPQAAA